MKKLFALIICLSMFFSVAAAEYEIVYTKTDGNYSWETENKIVAQDVLTGEILPLSYLNEDILYAYAPVGTKIKPAFFEPTLFNDRDEYGSFDLYTDSMSSKGIMVGNGDGTFGFDQVLSRAEMAAVFARFFSVSGSDSKSVYSDVSDDSWYAKFVMALNESGVFVTDDKFNPNESITNEQLVTMLYRMLKKRNLIEDKKYDITLYPDYSDISDYARSAYESLAANSYVLLESWENVPLDGKEVSYGNLLPRFGVTRGKTAQLLYYALHSIIFNNAPAIAKTDITKMPVIDGSTSTYPLTEALYWTLFYNSQNHESYPAAHSKTTVSYEKLINGEADLIFVPDASSAITELAKEKNAELKFIPIANEALVFFTGSSNPVNSLTSEQLHDIYVNNKFENWNKLGGTNAPLAAFCRNNDSGSHAQMEKFILNGEEIDEKIRQERTSIIMASILNDVFDCEYNNPGTYALGYSLYYYFCNVNMVMGHENNLKLLAIDGVMPNEQTIADGAYPFSTNYFAVIRADEPDDSPAMKIIELLQSPSGNDIIKGSGFGIMKKGE